MPLTESEKHYATRKVEFFNVGTPTQAQYESALHHMAGIKQLVSIPAERDSSGRIGGLYDWQRSPYD